MHPSLPELVPFVLTTRANAPFLRLDEQALGMPLRVIFIEDDHHSPFCQVLNHTNHLAFGGAGMGMPLWVLLDCGVLPSAVVGFASPFEGLPQALRAKLSLPADYPHELVPLTEYCASLTVEPGGVCGFSLQSQLEGAGLATRTKALAMWVYGATFQTGVTQFDNPAIRVHARLGPLRIQIHRPTVHTHPDKSFVYRVELPPAATLAAMARAELHEAPLAQQARRLAQDQRWRLRTWDEDEHQALRRRLALGQPLYIAPPAWEMTEQGAVLTLIDAL